MIDGSGHDAKGDVRGVKRVMAQRGRRIVGCRGAVHEGHWPERRFADRPAGQREAVDVVTGMRQTAATA